VTAIHEWNERAGTTCRQIAERNDDPFQECETALFDGGLRNGLGFELDTRDRLGLGSSCVLMSRGRHSCTWDSLLVLASSRMGIVGGIAKLHVTCIA
jgi:hypothetical protein